MGKALSTLFRLDSYSPKEKVFLRNFLHRSVQLKNRYRTVIERFTDAFPEKEDHPLDLRFFFLCQFYENPTRSRLEKEIHRLLYDKSRVRRFVHFLKTTPTRKIFPKIKTEDPVYLWLYHSQPLWMIRKWLGSAGYRNTLKLCEFNNRLPDASIRVNPLKISREECLASLQSEGIDCRPSRVSPLGIIAVGNPDLSAQPLYADGKFALQDLSSQLVCFYINPRPGNRVLDYDASGHEDKSFLFSHTMKGKGEIFVHVTQTDKIKTLRRRIKKEGVSNIRFEELENIQIADDPFGCVVLEAPCSRSGLFRHEPELKWSLTSRDLFEMNRKQLEILPKAASFCRPDGLFFYITRSIFKEENQKVIRRFLKLYPQWKLIPPKDFMAKYHRSDYWVSSELLSRYTDDRFFQILPHVHGLPGLFCAVLTTI